MVNVCGYISIKFLSQTKWHPHAHDILATVSFVNTRLDNGLSPKRWQAIFQTNVDLQKIVPLETKVIHDSNPKHQRFYRRNAFENSIYETTAIV